ncbi:hypothetical protein A7X92_10025 [Stenotrophomonas maltophilia]|nr:hypothetical protein A7X92_10025 [Stenotrophomonas maltophilia]
MHVHYPAPARILQAARHLRPLHTQALQVLGAGALDMCPLRGILGRQTRDQARQKAINKIHAKKGDGGD